MAITTEVVEKEKKNLEMKIDELGNVEIAGHKLTRKQYLGFKNYVTSKTNTEAFTKTGVSHETLRQWRMSSWWKDLYELFIRESQEDFMTEIWSRKDEVVKGFFSVVDPNNNNDRTASAKVNAAKLLMTAGKDPLIVSNGSAQINIQNNVSVETTGSIDRAKLDTLTADELLDIAKTGKVPNNIKVVN